jgi:hypothetical protein
MRIALLSSALLALGLSFPQKQGEPVSPPTISPGSKAAIAALLEDMQGIWTLKNLDSPTIQGARRQQAGYMLIAEKYFSLEMHLMWSSQDNQPHLRLTLTGTHSFELDEGLKMTAKQMIGSTTDNTGLITWEEPGRIRKFDVTCVGDVLKLRRDDGTVYEFERIFQDPELRDIYGRPLKLKDPNAPPKTPKDTNPPKDGKNPK